MMVGWIDARDARKLSTAGVDGSAREKLAHASGGLCSKSF